MFACDITQPEACADVFRRIAADGAVDVLVNNAGITSLARFVDETPAQLRRVMEVNFFGAVNCTQAALPGLIAARGQIVAVSSVAGFAPLYGRTAYSASKHALHGFFDSLRSELVDDGVAVTLVCPSFIDTNIQAHAGDTARKAIGSSEVMSPALASRHIVRAVASRTREIHLGRDAKLSYLLSRVAPALFERAMRRRVATGFVGAR